MNMTFKSDACEPTPNKGCNLTQIHTSNGFLSSGIRSDCIVVDWIGRNLYWVDGTAGQILAIQLTAVWRGKSEHTVVLDDDVIQPRALALDPLNG